MSLHHLLMFLSFPFTYYNVLISTHSFLSISLSVLSSIPLGVSEWLWEAPLMPGVTHHRGLNPEKTNRNFYFSGFQMKRNQHRAHSQNISVTKNTDVQAALPLPWLLNHSSYPSKDNKKVQSQL